MQMPIKNNLFMKRILTSIVLFALILSNGISKAQTTHPVELGFNIGASWLQSDVKMKKLGGAGGFTLGQMYAQNDKNALDWGWRFRYLNALTYGQDSKKTTGIAFNPVLNGQYDPSTNYFSNGGFVYQNHKTTINELSLELVIGANNMRNKTKVYPYIFGGLGITKAVAKTDQLDGSGLRYDYSSIDSNGTANGSQITSSLNTMYDGTYETFAEGSENARWKFMPSLGVGLGYQFTPAFSMGLEHKMTWALHDGLDGHQWTNENAVSASKDKYHYSSVWLKFSFGRKARPTTTVTNNNNTTTNIVTPAADKPSVVITNPSMNSFTSASQSFTVRATIKNVNSKSDIALVYNGVNNSNFTYDATAKVFAFPLMLLQGSNTFEITATNANGSTTDNATVLYETQIVTPPAAPAPVVIITSPTINPQSTTMNNATVVANILNVNSQSQIGVAINGVATGNFIFNPSTHMMTISSNLNPGANTFVISATNPSGSDSKSVTIIYSIATVTPPPFITIVNPAINPFTSTVSSLPINAVVQNVTAIGQIGVAVNGGNLPTSMLSFNPSTGQLNFNANLISGANAITVSATNVAGADSKSITIIYNQPVAVTPAPVVSITSPTVNPFNTSSNVATVNAIVLNVTSPSQISVLLNGISTTAFTYNTSTKQLTYTASLIAGANIVNINASNSGGSDSKSQTIIYAQPLASPAPIVSITAPNVNPATVTTASTPLTATVLNVVAAAQIAVSINGVATSSFAYNVATKQLTLSPALIVGANIVTITATTASGSDSKSITIIYSAPVANPAPIVTISSPNVNPFNTSTSALSVNGSVLNVVASSQINVVMNGVSIPFTYSTSTKLLTVAGVLIPGANSITITATTPSGSDFKSVTIIYTEPVTTTPAPIVTITNPITNPFTSITSTVGAAASVLNVTSSSEINVLLNGASVPFTYNPTTKKLVVTVSLISGANVVTITAATAYGSDSKSTTIIYTAPVALPSPIVTFIYPAAAASTFGTAVYNVEATVLNITSISNVVVKLNGVVVTTATYNPATKVVKFAATLALGNNTISITATNTSGTDSRTVTIKYNPGPGTITPINPDSTNSTANPGTPNSHTPGAVTPKGRGGASVATAPTIIFGLPNPHTASTPTIYVTAVVNGISFQTDAVVKVNGVVVPFAFAAKTKVISLTAALNVGTNTITITATNSVGSKTENLTITRP